MAIPFLADLDINRNSLLNVKIERLSDAPNNSPNVPENEARIIYNNDINKLMFHNGSAWVTIEDTGGLSGVTSLSGTAPIVVSSSTGAVTISISAASGSAAGSMSALDKTKLDAATSNNTASTLVLRDGSGNFTAGTITAAKITGLAAPTDPSDAANKAYVDAARSGLDAKQSVRVATTASITLSGTQVVDGVSLSVGNRVLVKNQGTASQNGIYVVASGAWSRADDADTNDKVNSGMFTFVEEGTVNDNTGWVLVTNNPITLGSTSLEFAKFSSQGEILAGNGLSKTVNTLAVVGTAGRISVSGAGVDIDAGYIGQTSITTLGTIATGTWSATAIASNRGGTGLTSVTQNSYFKGGASAGDPLVQRTYAEVKQDLALNNVENTALSTWAGSANITTVGNISSGTWGGTAIAANHGGTGQTSYTTGDLLYASSTSALAKLAGVATGNALISGGVGAAPSWGKIGLTTHVSGTLPATNGGTGINSYTTGNFLYANTATTLAQRTPTEVRGDIGATTKYTTTVGNGTDLSHVISHNLGNRDVQVYVYENSGDYRQVFCDVEHTSTTTATLRFSIAPTTSQYKVVVIG